MRKEITHLLRRQSFPKREHLEQSIQEWTKQNLWKIVFKKFEGIYPTYPIKCFKGCLPQLLLGSFLNTLPHFFLSKFYVRTKCVPMIPNVGTRSSKLQVLPVAPPNNFL